MLAFPVAPPGARMSIGFQSDEEILRTLREKLRKMTDEELIRFGKQVRRLAENPFQWQLDEARAEWKRRKKMLVCVHAHEKMLNSSNFLPIRGFA
jgi:hypothetical protein